MNGLGKRVDALEAIAEELRLRRWEALANERGITLEALVEAYAEAQAETARLRAEGLSDDEIIALKADRRGIPVEELRRRADELADRLA